MMPSLAFRLSVHFFGKSLVNTSLNAIGWRIFFLFHINILIVTNDICNHLGISGFLGVVTSQIVFSFGF